MDKLHKILQIIMGWSDYHLHQFDIGVRSFGVPDKDGMVEITNELLILPLDPGAKYPVCIKGKRASPPEDCGEVGGLPKIIYASNTS